MPTRRAFLSTAGAASAFVWIPKPVKGYTAADLRAFAASAGSAGITRGVSKWDLDTPALCLDLDAMERNVATMQAAVKRFGIVSRPCAKLTEAEAFFAAGIEPIMMTTSNPSPQKVRRAMALRKKNPQFIQAVDEEQNARDLSAAAKEADVIAEVVIDVAVGTRSGIPAGEGALALAKVIDTLPNLKLRGLLSYDGGVQHQKGFAARKARALQAIEANAATREAMKKAGLNVDIFSGGGTGTYNIMHLVPGFSDVQVGSYLFMDMQYLEIGGEDGNAVYKDFASSLTVTTTVMNNRFPGLLTTDAGTKALTLNKPNPGVVGEPGMEYTAGSDEFGTIKVTSASKSYRIGDKLEVIVPHCDPVVNEYDQIYGIRKDRVEVVWPITARGKSQ
jgi:D-serine deaminase-like pyridoxal phosphate-dependent protein